jgi:hypothetical protein
MKVPRGVLDIVIVIWQHGLTWRCSMSDRGYGRSRRGSYTCAEIDASEEIQKQIYGMTLKELNKRQKAGRHPKGCRCDDCGPICGVDG